MCSVTSSSLWPHGLYTPSGASVHGVFLARILEWVVISYSRRCSEEIRKKSYHCPYVYIYIFFFLLVVFKSFSLSCCSVAKSSPTLHIPMNCSTVGFPVSYNLPEFTQFYVHWIVNTIKPSHPLSPATPLALNLSQHQSFPMSWLFTSGGQNIETSASVLPKSMQGWFP